MSKFSGLASRIQQLSSLFYDRSVNPLTAHVLSSFASAHLESVAFTSAQQG